MHQLSLGLISTQQFCDDLRTLTKLPLTDEAIANAANKMLADIPDEKKAMLLRLRAEGKRVFLLSNTIDMHWNYCVKALFPYQGHTVDDYFEACFPLPAPAFRETRPCHLPGGGKTNRHCRRRHLIY